MKATDARKVFSLLKGITADSFDRVAEQLADAADKLGDEYAGIADFAKSWGKLSKKARRLFVEELIKSHGLIIAGTVATKAGIKLAKENQKQLRNLLFFVADMIQPSDKTKKKIKKKAKKAAKKTKKKIAEVAG